ncbi:MAG: histidine kinase [Dehalococcoidales bacterium]
MTIWALIPLITCLAYIALLVLTLPSIGRRINRLFAYYLAVAATWSLISFTLHLNAIPGLALFWNELVAVVLIWTLIAYYHFIRAYADKPAGKAVYVGYAMFMVLTVLSLNGYIVQYAYVVDGVLVHSLGNSLYLIGAISLAFIGGGIYTLVKRYRTSIDPVERNRTWYLIAGWSILMTLGYSNLIPPVAGIPLDHIGSLVNALIIAYAIGRYKLLDIRLVMRKGLVYSTLTVFLTTMYLLIIFILQLFFQDMFGYTSVLFAAGIALLAAVLFNPLRNNIQKWIDKLFYRETYDYRQMLLSFSDKVSNVLDLQELARSMLEPIVNSMHVKRAALLFPEPGSGDFRTRFFQPEDTDKAFTNTRLLNDNPIVTWLADKGEIVQRSLIDLRPQFKGLWEIERVALDALGIELLCPIRSKGTLVGILVLGEKQSGSSYSNDEANLFMTMANEVAVALENARMLDSIKLQQVQVEKLLAQVVMAQEEERKRISADLHDSVAQWLAAASYRVQTVNALLPASSPNEAKAELITMEDTIDKSLKELRRIVIGLRPPALDELGLEHSLRQSLGELRTDGPDCRFTKSGNVVRLPSSVEIAVYRAVQEALTNIRKHAGASKVSLHMQYHSEDLVIRIRDNGKGFDLTRTLDSAVAVGHMGVLGMKQRAETLGGEMNIVTHEGTGTTITLRFPIQIPVEDI